MSSRVRVRDVREGEADDCREGGTANKQQKRGTWDPTSTGGILGLPCATNGATVGGYYSVTSIGSLNSRATRPGRPIEKAWLSPLS